MRGNFETLLPKLFDDEGGYCNDAGDPGGPTKYGIIYADLVAWRGAPKNAAIADRIATVRSVSKDEAAAIYKAKYWTSLRCDDLPAGVDYAVFDFGVNSGIYRAAKFLQRIVGVKSDGIVGGMTLAGVARAKPEAVIDALCDQRMSFLRHLGNWWRFGKGWKARVLHVHADALLMAREAAATAKPIEAPPVASAPAIVGGLGVEAVTTVTSPLGSSAAVTSAPSPLPMLKTLPVAPPLPRLPEAV